MKFCVISESFGNFAEEKVFPDFFPSIIMFKFFYGRKSHSCLHKHFSSAVCFNVKRDKKKLLCTICFMTNYDFINENLSLSQDKKREARKSFQVFYDCQFNYFHFIGF